MANLACGPSSCFLPAMVTGHTNGVHGAVNEFHTSHQIHFEASVSKPGQLVHSVLRVVMEEVNFAMCSFASLSMPNVQDGCNHN